MGLGIHRRNSPILQFAENHPARRVLEARWECQRDCAGCELRDIDQEWESEIDHRRWTFSGVVYAYVCFDLILHGWLHRPPHLAEDEIGVFAHVAKIRLLLGECHRAATCDKNGAVLEMISLVSRFLDLWEEAIRLRIQEDRIVT
jgi:hypothetical protein